MKQLLDYKREIILVFLVGLSLSVMVLYQTYAVDVPKNEYLTLIPSPDIKYTMHLTNDINNSYTISVEPGETKLIDLTLTNENDYNLKYTLYTTNEEIKENTLLAVLNTSESQIAGVINKKESTTVSLVAINKTKNTIEYEISYLTGYEKGGELTPTTGTLIKDIYSFANAPKLDDNMIPIVYDTTKNTWVVADTTNTHPDYYWYEYFLKRWANIAIINKDDIIDISNNGNTGKNNGSNLTNGSVITNGTDASVDAGLKSHNFGNNLSLIVRTKLTSHNGIAHIVSNLDKSGFALYLTDEGYLAGVVVSEQTNNYHYFQSSIKLTENEWCTIALTYDNNNINLYLNGKLLEPNIISDDYNTKLTGNIKISSNPITIGAKPNNNSSNSNYYNGEISDVIIFNNVLTQDEITNYFTKEIDSTHILNNLNNPNHNMIMYYDFSKSKKIPVGTIIKADNTKSQTLDVKTYYTWIPRYKYRVWNIEKESGQTAVTLDNGNIYEPYNSQNNSGIEIIFETDTNTTGTISCNYNSLTTPETTKTLSEVCIGKNGEFYTHPAFTLDNKELTGFWIGKYETSYEDSNIIIKNDTKSFTNQNLSEYHFNITKMTNSQNVYGLNPEKFTSRIIKNTEWGAVAYLSISNLGLCQNRICNQMGINNYLSSTSDYQTGCGAKIGTEQTTICNSFYTDEGIKASTTGNVYGVYDMAGGAAEYVMGNLANNTGSFQSGNSNLYKNNLDSKYYDLYANGNTETSYSQLDFNRSRLGDAIGEISLDTSKVNNGWYNAATQIGGKEYSWLVRGGTGKNATQFNSNQTNGEANQNITTRAVLN